MLICGLVMLLMMVRYVSVLARALRLAVQWDFFLFLFR